MNDNLAATVAPTAWFTDSNFSTILGQSYEPKKHAPNVAAMRQKFEDHRPLLASIIEATGFSPSNISTILSSSKMNAVECLKSIQTHLDSIVSLTTNGQIPASNVATMLRGKGKQLPEALAIIEAEWEKIAAIRRATADTRPGLLTSKIGNVGLNRWPEMIDALCREYEVAPDGQPATLLENPIALGRLASAKQRILD